MERLFSSRRDRLLDHLAGELVAEGDTGCVGYEHPAVDAFVEVLDRISSNQTDHTQVGRLRDCHGLQQGPGSPTETGGSREYRIPHRRWDLMRAGGQHLGDEERVSAGSPIKLHRIHFGRASASSATARGESRGTRNDSTPEARALARSTIRSSRDPSTSSSR